MKMVAFWNPDHEFELPWFAQRNGSAWRRGKFVRISGWHLAVHFLAIQDDGCSNVQWERCGLELGRISRRLWFFLSQSHPKSVDSQTNRDHLKAWTSTRDQDKGDFWRASESVSELARVGLNRCSQFLLFQALFSQQRFWSRKLKKKIACKSIEPGTK